MLKLVLLIALFLSGCTVVEPVPVASAPPPPPAKSKYVEELEKFRAEVGKRQAAVDEDKTARAVRECAGLFSRGSDGERLCIMRSMDRYVDHATPPLSDRYLRRDDEISVKIPRREPEPAPVSPQPHTHHIPQHGYATPDGGWVYPQYVAPSIPPQGR